MASDMTELVRLAHQFQGDDVVGIGLTGSFARGDAGPYSDIDLLRLARHEDFEGEGDGSHWTGGRLVNVSTLMPSSIDKIFDDPVEATSHVAGLRVIVPLVDSEGQVARLRERALNFEWDDRHQQQADVWASKQMVGWAEEAYKGLEGLRRNDPARLLQARFGCTWGLSNVMGVQRGVLQISDNDFLESIDATMTDEPTWVRLRHQAFGLAVDGVTTTLRQQVEAGLQLYVETAHLLADILQPGDQELIWTAANRIREVLGMEDA